MERNLKILLGFYLVSLLIVAPFIYPNYDSFYYWDWGNHLEWSYMDGPPMIGYMMHLTTLFFGATFFSISMVGICCSVGVCYFVYKTGLLFHNKNTGLLALCLWAFGPAGVATFITGVTYDLPEMLFWSSTLYYTSCYITFQKVKYLYLMGSAAGLMLLSKYTGVILIVAILIYFASKDEFRYIFKKLNFYIAGLVCIVLFSPVIIWNAKHNWISVTYLIGYHLPHMSSLSHLRNTLHFPIRLIQVNYLFVLISILLLIKRPKNSHLRSLMIAVSFSFSFTWFLLSYFAEGGLPPLYLAPLAISMVLVSSVTFRQGCVTSCK